jgi:hypothetical protein
MLHHMLHLILHLLHHMLHLIVHLLYAAIEWEFCHEEQQRSEGREPLG